MEARSIYGRPLPSPHLLPVVGEPALPPLLSLSNGHQQHQLLQQHQIPKSQQSRNQQYPYGYYQPSISTGIVASNSCYHASPPLPLLSSHHSDGEEFSGRDNCEDADEEDLDEDGQYIGRSGLLQSRQEPVIDSDDELIARGVVDPVVMHKGTFCLSCISVYPPFF